MKLIHSDEGLTLETSTFESFTVANLLVSLFSILYSDLQFLTQRSKYFLRASMFLFFPYVI